MGNTEQCSHQWILPRYFETRERSQALVTGTCLTCRHRHTASIDHWIETLADLLQKSNKQVRQAPAIHVLAEQLGKKFHIIY